MKKILVTGGAGFIGSHTCVQLQQAGYTPVVVDNFCASERHIPPRIEQLMGDALVLYELDCRDRSALARVMTEEGVVGVIHFAAHKSVGVSTRQPLEYYANNVGSLIAALQAMDDCGLRHFVFSSSCTVYGQPDQLPVTEQMPRGSAESPYGRSKQMCEQVIVDAAVASTSLQAVILRYFNPIGAHPSGLLGELPLGKPETLVPYIVQTAVGLRPELTVFGGDYPTQDGTCVRDYLHIVDLANAHVAAVQWLERQPAGALSEAFNLGTGRGTSVLEAIGAFERATGQRLKYSVGERRAGDVVQVYAGVEKAKRQLGWTAELGLDQAMADAYRWQLSLGAEGRAVAP